MVNQGLGKDDQLRHWRQGDYALNVGGFLYAGTPEGSDLFDAEETTDEIVGLIVISQTCDIIRRTGGRHYVAVCPLIEVDPGELSAIQKGRQPYLTDVENVDEGVVADLRRVMSVHKDVLHTWERQNGFSSDAKRLRFAAALERKFGQFAFPDEFDQATKEFRGRVWSRHNKPDSEPGKAYRSLEQIRFSAYPDWTAEHRKVTVVAIMRETDDCEVERHVIHRELNDNLIKIKWPKGYEWNEPPCILGTAIELSASDLISSQRGDFDYLCY